MRQPSSRLIHVLLGKSILETIFVGALAIVFFVNAFPPSFRGWGEVAGQSIAGWAVDSNQPGRQVQVQLFIDGRFIATGLANTFRPDVRAAGWATDDWHGYVFPVPSQSKGFHVARIYAIHESGSGMRQTLQMLGDPIYFSVDEAGAISAVK